MKKIIALLLALTMVLAFAACAKTEAPAEDKEPEAPVELETPATEPEAPVEEAPVEDEPAEEAPVEEAPVVMTHEEYMAAAIDDPICIETYVQATQSWWFDSDAGYGKISVYAQSQDGAYFLYELKCDEADAAKMVPGTKLLVEGFKGEWSGEVEVVDGTFTFEEGGDTFIAEALDVTELLGTEELIAHQNEFVSFTGMTVEAIEYKNGEPGDDIYVTLGYNGASYSFCVEVYFTGTDSEVYTTVGTLNVGDVVNVEGFLYWYEGANPHISAITVA